MSTSAIGTILDAIRTALVARSGLTGVNVFTGGVPIEDAGLECIAFLGATLDEAANTNGGNRLETWRVQGATQVIKPWQGTTEESIKAARDRALAIFAELETHLNDTYKSELPVAEITDGELTQFYSPEGRMCDLSFTMTIRAVKNP